MRTEYKYGLGKDQRELSYFQTKDWMDRIGGKRKYEHCVKGEKNGNARLTEKDVYVIRKSKAFTRKIVCWIFKITERHWYNIRAKKAWKHL